MKNLLSQYIELVVSESSQSSRNEVEKIKDSDGITLQRVGGLSPVRQKGNRSAPERRGVYCFIYPYFDKWQLGSTSHRGIADSDDFTRADEFKTSGLRKFKHSGKLYTILSGVPGSTQHKSGWYETDGVSLKKYLKKFHALQTGQILSLKRMGIFSQFNENQHQKNILVLISLLYLFPNPKEAEYNV